MKYKVGELVVIKDGLKVKECYGGLTLFSEMKFNGQLQIMDVQDNGVYRLSNGYIYSHEMLSLKNDIERVTFNNPATIIHFTDGTKTIVKATENDKYNPTIGFLYAYFEKMSGMSKTQCGKFFDNLEEEYAEQLERKMKKRSKKNK